MTPEKEIAKKITAYLDQGAADLRAGTAYRLQQARAAALARLDPVPDGAPAVQPALAAARAGRGGTGRGWHAGPVRWLGVVLIVAAAGFAFQQWRAVQQVREMQDIDLQILTSDLPIDAYVDRGFANWLRAGSDN